MNIEKHIFLLQEIALGAANAQVQVTSEDTQGSFACFYALADQLRITFPQAKTEDILVRRVYASNGISHSVIVWNGWVPIECEYSGWKQMVANPDLLIS